MRASAYENNTHPECPSETIEGPAKYPNPLQSHPSVTRATLVYLLGLKEGVVVGE